jgi:CRISPR-associated protein Cmr4
VRIDENTRTVADGALWLEESLPPETLLLGLLAADRSRRPGVDLAPDAVLNFALPGEQVLQFGGKATTGRGRCRMVPVPHKPEAGHGAA